MGRCRIVGVLAVVLAVAAVPVPASAQPAGRVPPAEVDEAVTGGTGPAGRGVGVGLGAVSGSGVDADRGTPMGCMC